MKTETFTPIFRDALDRWYNGNNIYGELDLKKDKRNFLKEAEEELLDTINYAAVQIMKLRQLDKKIKRIEELTQGGNVPDDK